MYKKEEAAHIRKEFWTRFGQYMHPIPGAGTEPVNWINYKTGNAFVQYKMHFEKNAVFEIIVSGDAHISNQIFHLFSAAYPYQFSTFEMESDEQTGTHKLFKKLENVSIYNKAHWPDVITMFKDSAIRFDGFWFEAKDIASMF